MTDELSSRCQAYEAPGDLLKDRVILITGAGDGIGKAAALAYAAHGATVVLLGRTKRKLVQTYDEIVEAGGAVPAIVVMDLSKAQGPEYYDLADQITKEYGRLDGLLHNASLLGALAPFEHIDIGTWHEVMHVNVNAQFVLTQILWPLLKAAPDPSIIFTSSGVGRKGRALWGAYSVSKFATEGLAQVIADEMSETPMRVNCINPGATRTAMRARAYPAENVMKLKTPPEIMAPYLYLMGPESAGVTGQSVNCQG